MTDSQRKTAGVAIASLVLGILGIVCFGPLGAVPAVICGHVAKSKIRASGGTLQGEGLALAGLILGYLGIVITVVGFILFTAAVLPAVAKARESAQQAMCLYNMHQIAMAKEQAAMEHSYRDGDPVPEAELSKYLKEGLSALECPKGGQYTVNPLGQDPECSVHGTMSKASPEP